MLPCLTEDILVRFLEERLPGDERALVLRHIADCTRCRQVIAELVRDVPGSAETADRAISLALWRPPSSFDDFEIERLQGKGGMGVVYLGRDRVLDRLVAIKFIASHEPAPQARERFLLEARTIARLRHPNIVTAYRMGEVAGHPYLVSEFVPGRSLAELALPRPWQEVRGIGLQLARALAAVHHAGILHRDIKPSNVLLDEDGTAKLVDFGLAQLVESQSAPAMSSSGGGRYIAGTRPYLAPEVEAGRPATFASDIYSYGVLLHLLCLGAHLLWDAPAEAPRLGAVSGIDRDFARFIERCLAVEPAGRFVSGMALYEALDRLMPPRAALGGQGAQGPYRGLLPFAAEHRGLFFGRIADVRNVLAELRRKPLVLIAGDSGVGKSSLCHAGVLPRVAEGALGEERRYTCLALVPGRRPLRAIVVATAPLLGLEESALAGRLCQEPWFLGQALRQRYSQGQGLLLFIDQLEELVTISDPDEARRVADVLAELALPASGLRLLLAVRGDFLTRLGAFPGLGDELERAFHLIRPLTADGIREAIVAPARSQGVAFESEALVADLVAAGSGSAGGLPLLQFALAELWNARGSEERLTRAMLEEIGGVAGALARHADGVLARLAARQRQAARRILLALVTEDGTRVRRGRAELVGGEADAAAALDALVAGRLVCTGQELAQAGDGTYELAHEALVASWGALRTWRDAGAGQRELRLRLEAAARDWERLGRTRDGLWSERQLGELAGLDLLALGAREQAFVAASRRAVRRRWYGRVGMALAMLSLTGGVYGAVRLEQRHAQAVALGVLLQKAGHKFTEGRAARALATRQGEDAAAQFEGRAVRNLRLESAEARQAAWDQATHAWTEATASWQAADRSYAAADALLQEALFRDPSEPLVRMRLAEVLCERVIVARRQPDQGRRRELEQRLALVDVAGRWRDQLAAPARLHIDTQPSGSRVHVERYVDDHGQRVLSAVSELAGAISTPVTALRLAPGSYLLSFTRPGRPPARLPIALDSGEERSLVVPLPASVPAGYAYVPPGCFFFGDTDFEALRKFFRSPPRHRVCMSAGYLIGHAEVTIQDWLRYLDDLPPGAPPRHLFEQVHRDAWGGIRLRQVASQWEFAFFRAENSEPELRARAGQLVRYPHRPRLHAEQDWRRFPMVGVSVEDIQGYLAWLDHSGRLPGARLCNEHEWERAARGADDRLYPHGDVLTGADANYLEAHGGSIWKNYGLDEVGAHPASVSPFGLVDMSGNAWELVQPIAIEPAAVTIRGGSYYYQADILRVTLRQESQPNQRDVTIGFRVCAPPGAP